MNSKGTAVFIDTSIVIGGQLRGRHFVEKVDHCLSQYDAKITGEITRLEFKRRVLKEANFILGVMKNPQYSTVADVHRHVDEVLPVQQMRKRNIDGQLIKTFLESHGRTISEKELFERFRVYLRSYLRFGVKEFESRFTHVLNTSGCAASRYKIKEVKPYSVYDFGPGKCRDSKDCEIEKFLDSKKQTLRKIQQALRNEPDNVKSNEIKKIESFLENYLDKNRTTKNLSPCLEVGDLLIALESEKIENFFTMNIKESGHLCKILDQTLIVRPNHWKHDNRIFKKGETWDLTTRLIDIATFAERT